MAQNNTENDNSVFKDDKSVYNKKIKSVPKPTPNIGIDTSHDFYNSIVESGENNLLDTSDLNNFTSVSQSRDQLYSALDSMCEDPTIASALNIYSEDVTEMSDNGRIVWCESTNKEVSNYVTYLLDSLRVDKNIYSWTQCLIKYGDVYLRLYRQSDYEKDSIFSTKNSLDKNVRSTLNEDIKIKAYGDHDHYVHYVEMTPNPAEVFELTKFGKTCGYIKADINSISSQNLDQTFGSLLSYKFKSSDIEIHEATDFVHGALEDNLSRTKEEVNITIPSNDSDTSFAYSVKRGQSMFYKVFKIWRELSLLENSILLNRVTKSSVVRIVSVEVGDMGKEDINKHLRGIKSLMEQKTSLKVGSNISEYTNAGPIENNIYIPTKNGVGAITIDSVASDPNVGSLDDLNYFQNKLYGAISIPKQFLGQTDDSTGFNGGSSLTTISSNYAKKIKKIQNVMIQLLTDLVNLFLIDSGLSEYINKFKIKMLTPSTQEETDRVNNMSSRVQLSSDIMNQLDLIEDPSSKLKILKALLSNSINNQAVLDELQNEIDKMESVAEEEEMPTEEEESTAAIEVTAAEEPSEEEIDLGASLELGEEEQSEAAEGETEGTETIESEEVVEESVDSLPLPSSLGIDFTNSNSKEFN